MKFVRTKDGKQVAVVETYGIGMEAGPILDWMDTVFYALSKLRSSDLKLDKSRDEKTLKDLYTCINDLTRLEPRFEGLKNTLIRAHREAGGTHGELALALDSPRSTASTQARTICIRKPQHWETWARMEMSPSQELINAEELQSGYVLVRENGRNEQITDVALGEENDEGLVFVKTGATPTGAFTYQVGDPVNVVPKVPSQIEAQS